MYWHCILLYLLMCKHVVVLIKQPYNWSILISSCKFHCNKTCTPTRYIWNMLLIKQESLSKNPPGICIKTGISPTCWNGDLDTMNLLILMKGGGINNFCTAQYIDIHCLCHITCPNFLQNIVFSDIRMLLHNQMVPLFLDMVWLSRIAAAFLVRQNIFQLLVPQNVQPLQSIGPLSHENPHQNINSCYQYLKHLWAVKSTAINEKKNCSWGWND